MKTKKVRDRSVRQPGRLHCWVTLEHCYWGIFFRKEVLLVGKC
jgi:hypothetical protein